MSQSASSHAPLRFLFSLLHSGYLRHYEEPIRLLAARGHHVHLTLAQYAKDVGDAELLERLLADCPTVTAQVSPQRMGISGWRRMAWFARAMADYARYADPRYAHADALRQRVGDEVRERLAAQRIDPVTRRLIAKLVSHIGSASDAKLSQTWIRRFALLEETIPVNRATLRLIRSFRPDAVLASPVVEVGSQQVEILRAAQKLRLPTAVSVASWDNLTNKGLIRVVPDRVIVWNEAQVDELEHLQSIPRDRAVVTGAQRYDEWFERRPARSREEFARRVGVDPARPILLYVCSSAFITPHEAPFVRRWLEALRDAADTRLAHAGVIVRPHPQNTEQWLDADLSAFGNAVVWPRRGRMPDSGDDRADYFDSLSHCAAVVGINTSALLEAAVVGRATYTLLAPEFAGTQDHTLHFQYLRIENGGVLHVAPDIESHLQQLAHGLDDPTADCDRTRAFVARFIRPHGLTVPAAPLVAAAIEELGGLTAAPVPHRLARLALRPPLAVVAALMGLGAATTRLRPPAAIA